MHYISKSIGINRKARPTPSFLIHVLRTLLCALKSLISSVSESSRNIHDDSTPNIVLRVTANIVFGYAT